MSEAANDTPPTSKLVSKLFPKLKPQQEKQQQEDQSKIQTASQASVGDGVQSKALRDKLIELEREIEKFRNENSHLAKLRTDREEVHCICYLYDYCQIVVCSHYNQIRFRKLEEMFFFNSIVQMDQTYISHLTLSWLIPQMVNAFFIFLFFFSFFFFQKKKKTLTFHAYCLCKKRIKMKGVQFA